MALPIKETPILTGEDAERFIKSRLEMDKRTPTEKDRSDYLRAKALYDKMGDLP